MYLCLIANVCAQMHILFLYINNLLLEGHFLIYPVKIINLKVTRSHFSVEKKNGSESEGTRCWSSRSGYETPHSLELVLFFVTSNWKTQKV